MKLQCFGKVSFGYGDIIMPLCFAQTEGEIYRTTVTLNFRWEFGPNDKNMPIDFADAVFNRFKFPNVNLIHSFNCLPEIDVDINKKLRKPLEINKFNILYFPFEKTEELYDVVCSPLNNKDPFVPKAQWKQGLTNQQWLALLERPNTKHVDYRISTNEAIDILTKCRMFIGYHGSCTWLARMVGVPMKVYSGQPGLSKYNFPWNDEDYATSKEKLMLCRENRDKYVKQCRKSFYDTF